MGVLRRRSRLPVSAEEAFAWHERPGAFERLVPPFFPMRLVSREGGVEPGARTTLRVPLGPLRLRWVAEHTESRPGRLFRDVQVHGPFAAWEHTHRFEPAGPAACIVEDEIRYRLPLGFAGEAIAGRWIRERLEDQFAYRHRVLAGDLEAHRRTGGAMEGGSRMHVAITGASGFIGLGLVSFLTAGGHRVTRIGRGGAETPGAGAGPGAADPLRSLTWDPAAGRLDPAALVGVGGVVHLAGESIGGRLTRAKRERILESRRLGTRTLVGTLTRMASPPRVLVSASAIGFYGADRAEDLLDETAGGGSDFLSEVCRVWEAETAPARDAGIRVVNLRLGIVLHPGGGALARMLLPFRLGLGGPIGHGRQWWSWIAYDDLLDATLHALTEDTLDGPCNAVAPAPVRQREFARVLGRVLRRPAVAPLPAPGARLLLGRLADLAVLASQRVAPARLTESGFPFRFPTLEPALRHLLGR